MFCITDENGDEVSVVKIGVGKWEAALPNGEYQEFLAEDVTAASVIAKTLKPTVCKRCGDTDATDQGYCTCCFWDVVEEQGGDREDYSTMQEDWHID